MKKLFVLICAVAVMGQAASPRPSTFAKATADKQAASPKPSTFAKATADKQAPSPFSLTVDNIMRGPELVGNPPNSLRWSGDSKELYFEWLMPKEDQAATWVVSRDGGAPKRLSESERRHAPLPNGQWDSSRRRILGVDRGDIVVIDT